MRLALIAVGLLGVQGLKVCNSDKAPNPEPSAEVTTSVAASAESKARFGGHVTSVGDHLVELKVHKNGHVHAWVTDRDGKELAQPAKAKLKVKLAAKGGARPEVALDWKEPRARFIGKADAKAELEAAPIEVSLDLDGKLATATVADVALLAEAEHGGHVVAVGSHSVELLVGADGNVDAFVKTAAGADVDGSANLDLKVKLPDVSGKVHLVALAWVPARLRFSGKVDGNVTLAPGPIEVALNAKAGAKAGGLAKLAFRADASHGGRMVAVGDYNVELVALGNGLVAAYVFDASGKAHVAGDLDLRLALPDLDVKLEWDAPSLSYRAKLAANVDIHAQPIEVALSAKGRAHVGYAAALDAKARADLKANLNAKLDADAKATAAAAAKLGADAKAKIDVKAPKIEVQAPKVDLNVQRSASATAKAGTSTNTQASAGTSAKAGAGAKAGFSFGTR